MATLDKKQKIELTIHCAMLSHDILEMVGMEDLGLIGLQQRKAAETYEGLIKFLMEARKSKPPG